MIAPNKKGFASTPEDPGGSKIMLWIRDVALTYDGDECLIWPFARDPSGYGQFGRHGKKVYAHRYICERTHGAPPHPKDHAAHSCDNGSGGCITRKHLAWKSNAQNQLDRYRGRPRRPRTKLTDAQVREIRAMKGAEAPHITARRYGIVESYARQIQSGRHRAERTIQPRTGPTPALSLASRALASTAIRQLSSARRGIIRVSRSGARRGRRG